MCVFPWTGDTWSFFRSWLFFHMNVLWNVVNTCRHNTMFFPNGLQTGQPAECSRSFSTCKHRCWQSQTGFWWVATHGWPAVLKWQLGIQRGCPTGTGTLYNCTRATGGQLCDISPQWHRNVKGSHGGEWSSSHLGWDSIYMMCILAWYMVYEHAIIQQPLVYLVDVQLVRSKQTKWLRPLLLPYPRPFLLVTTF